MDRMLLEMLKIPMRTGDRILDVLTKVWIPLSSSLLHQEFPKRLLTLGEEVGYTIRFEDITKSVLASFFCIKQFIPVLIHNKRGINEFEARWIGWADVNVPDEVGQRSITKARLKVVGDVEDSNEYVRYDSDGAEKSLDTFVIQSYANMDKQW